MTRKPEIGASLYWPDGDRRANGKALACNLLERIAKGEAVKIGPPTLDRLEGASRDRSPVSTKHARMIGRQQATVADVARAVLGFARDGVPLKPTNEPNHCEQRGKAA